MTVIVFYNLAHNGDTYFSQKIVEAIYKQNPQYEFKYFVLYNHYIFKDIKNLQNYINEDLYYITGLELGFSPDSLINNQKYIDAKNFFNKNEKKPYFFENNILGINTWGGGMTVNSDCDLLLLYTSMQKLLDKIYTETNIHLNCYIENMSELIPSIPDVNIDKFINWYNTQPYKYIVLYYNYLGKSGQLTPLNHDLEHIQILTILSQINSNIVYIVPSMTKLFEQHILENNIKNIISCENIFDCQITPSCENIYKLIKIGNMCNLVIYYDIGACFTNFNSDILNPTYKKNRVHLGISSAYYDRFKSYLKLVNINIEDKITFIESNDINNNCNILFNLLCKFS